MNTPKARATFLTIMALCCNLAFVSNAGAQDLDEQDGYRGHWLRTPAAEVFVAIEPQFRVLAFRRPGEASMMAGRETEQHGLRLAFMEPEQIPASFDVGNVPAEVVERSEKSLHARLAPAAGLQYEVKLTLAQDRPVLSLDYALKNVDTHARTVACWSVVAYALDGVIVAPFGDQPKARRRLVLPWWTRWPQPHVRFGRDALAMDVSTPVEGNAMKIGITTEAGWVAFIRGSSVLQSSVRFEPNAAYPEGGANVTVFQGAGWCETEQVGPLVTLKPGESVTMRETLGLLAVAFEPDASPDAIRDTLPSAPTTRSTHD
jgi:hypothetical protein